VSRPFGSKNYPSGTLCGAKGCERAVQKRGLCNPHYQRQRLGREVEAPMRPKRFECLQQAFDFYTEETEHGLVWNGTTGRGYGRLCGGTGGKSKMAHRVAWELVNGPIAEGLELDHDPGCPRNCVTVEHLTPRTKSDHAKIGWERGQFVGNGWTDEARAKRIKTATCILCGAEYTRDSRSKYCAITCSIKAGNLKRKERQLGVDPGTLCPTLDFDTFSRSKVWEEESGICGICGEPADPNRWHLDHIVPRSLGGLHIRSNVQVSHPACNMSKGNKLISTPV